MMKKMDSYPNLFEINLEQHQVCLGHQYAHVSARSIYHTKIYYTHVLLLYEQLCMYCKQYYIILDGRQAHSSQFEGLCSMKMYSKTLQNLPYFWNTKTHVVFFVFHFVLLYFFPNECPGLCQHRPGHPLLKIQSCLY